MAKTAHRKRLEAHNKAQTALRDAAVAEELARQKAAAEALKAK